jgi:hypothetical protein
VLPVGALLGGCDCSGGDFGLGSLTGSDRVAFRCDGDRGFRVNYNNDGDEAVVDAGDETYRLDLRDRDGSRRQYEGDSVELIVNGNEARLRISGDDDYSDCERI